ncbi:hypothetical protein D0865_10696 [Hortaea werneckii]|uniref:Formin GTPase-binding domain-containing protein n=1 Tax=Hortaea werneckii TaxID=91943 RepID=A0A3M7BXF5_HORWE|nr:hypothetical protein D0865_10696 [Hortaea werneckii]
MDSAIKNPEGERPAHRRNVSSKSNILRSFVSPKSRPASPERNKNPAMRTKSVPLLPPDHPHAGKGKVLGERQGNVQSPPSSPSKVRPRSVAAPKDNAMHIPTKTKDGPSSPKKSKSSTSLSTMFAKMNRSSKDLSAQIQRDKENTTPPTQEKKSMDTPIWARFSSNLQDDDRPKPRDSKVIEDEITRYTPQEYSPSKQRNFNGTLSQSDAQPTLNSRPQSSYGGAAESLVGAVTRRVSGNRSSTEARRSEDSGQRQNREGTRRVSGERPVLSRWKSNNNGERHASGSSCEQDPAKEKINVAKRGGRVMAAVAALQGKSKTEHLKQEPELDQKTVDEAFETVLDSRNIPEPMRQKMRSLTLQVKADFIKQDQGLKTAGNSPTGSISNTNAADAPEDAAERPALERKSTEDDSKTTKRSRTRSRNFTFGMSDKRNDASPSKKNRSRSRGRPNSTLFSGDEIDAVTPAATTTTTSKPFASLGRKSGKPAAPADYISYLEKHRDLAKLDDERLHKLRLLLRNETVAWVDNFVSLGGMEQIVDLLQRIMAVEWREDHEDKLLHEALLCLKGLCTTERAMTELEKVADELFPALIQMLFDEEKKGPAEYTTRSIIVTVLFNFLADGTGSTSQALEHRAQRVLSYLREQKKDDQQPVDFVLDMHMPRPYKSWSREVTNVTKEVFWIFLHHLNVVPLPRPGSGPGAAAAKIEGANSEERQKVLAATYSQRHFPGSRPPVPAAPYIGGVEWDATTYITAHLDLLNGLVASLPTASARNVLRDELQASGFERVMGATLRTCKEKFYSGVHDGLRAWVAAAAEDGWDTKYVREGPTQEEQADKAKKFLSSPKKSPKKGDEAPKLDNMKVEALPKLSLNLGMGAEVKSRAVAQDNDDDGWLG